MGKKNPITRKIIPTSRFAATTALMMAAAALMLSIPVSNTAATAQEIDLMIDYILYVLGNDGNTGYILSSALLAAHAFHFSTKNTM
jgi:hypothetical protein